MVVFFSSGDALIEFMNGLFLRGSCYFSQENVERLGLEICYFTRSGDLIE